MSLQTLHEIMEGKCIFLYLFILQVVGTYLIKILMTLISVRVLSFETWVDKYPCLDLSNSNKSFIFRKKSLFENI